MEPMFAIINRLLSKLAESTDAMGWMFKFFTRILPVPLNIVRGVPIRTVIPLNQYGVFVEIRNWERREPETLDWIDAFGRDTIFFDIGASFGNETLYAALKKNGPRKIVSFDVDLLASFNLALNLRINEVEKVEQYHLAVSARSEVLLVAEHTNYACVPGRPRYDKVAHKTWAISIDDFVKMTGDRPNFVKIDVDGHEEEVIRGMRETLKSELLEAILVEVNQRTQEAVSRMLQASGFRKQYQSAERRDAAGCATWNLIFSRVRQGQATV